MQKVTIDILGFAKATARGKKYILVIVDNLATWAEALLMPDERAETVAKLLVEKFVCRYDIPSNSTATKGNNSKLSYFRKCAFCYRLARHGQRLSIHNPMAQQDNLGPTGKDSSGQPIRVGQQTPVCRSN